MSNSTSHDASPAFGNRWDDFWFRPAPLQRVGMLRSVLAVIAAVYFLSCWSDLAFWYTEGGPLSPRRVSTFLRVGDLDDAARWILSPLFLVESAWLYQLWLVAGVLAAALVAAGRGGRTANIALWLLLVGWANRAMLVSGLAESLLSLGLFAAAIAPSQASWRRHEETSSRSSWTAGLSQRLMAVQVTVVLAATFVTMLAGRVWFNGLGAYALAAPWQDRTLQLAQSGMLRNPFVHETLTHLMVVALPLGLLLSWRCSTTRWGQGILVAWCGLVAVLGSHWLYAATLATLVLAIEPSQAKGE